MEYSVKVNLQKEITPEIISKMIKGILPIDLNNLILNVRINSSEYIKPGIISDIIRKRISPLVTDLNLSALQEICFTDNLLSEVNNINEKYNLETIKNSEHYTIFGKTCRINDIPHFIVVCRIEVLLHIKDESRYAQRMCNTIHHELCHVSDYTKRDEFYKKVDKIEHIYTIKNIGVSRANQLFEEYVANRLSVSSMDGKDDLGVQTAIDCYYNMKEVATNAIQIYRISNDALELINSVSPVCMLLLVQCCYIIGNLHGLGNPHELNTLLKIKWHNTPFQSLWGILEKELDYLYSIYGCWNDLSVLDNLSKLYFSSLFMNGIELEDYKKALAFLTAK